MFAAFTNSRTHTHPHTPTHTYNHTHTRAVAQARAGALHRCAASSDAHFTTACHGTWLCSVGGRGWFWKAVTHTSGCLHRWLVHIPGVCVCVSRVCYVWVWVRVETYSSALSESEWLEHLPGVFGSHCHAHSHTPSQHMCTTHSSHTIACAQHTHTRRSP